MAAVTTFTELLLRLKEAREKFDSQDLKLNAQGVYTVIMAGSLDGLLEKPPSIAERFVLMEQARAILKSKTMPAAGKKGSIGIADIVTELDRHVWLAQQNPFYCFRFADQYSNALKVLGYSLTNAPNLVARDSSTDVFSNWGALCSTKVVTYYTNPNVRRRVAIVAQYMGFETKQYSRGTFLKLKCFDGSQQFEVTVWPEYGKTTFPPKLASFVRSQRKSVAIFAGKLTSSRGFTNLSIQDIQELS